MTPLTDSIVEGFKTRRSIHTLTNESTISDERIKELISEVVLHTPSSFNSQSSRLVVFLKKDHEKLWDIAREVASSSVPPELFEKLLKPRIEMFRASYGTVLFYEDPTPIKALEEKWPMLKDQFPEWSNHSSGMHQFAAWTLLEAEGLGCNLQHYNSMLNVSAPISEEWNVPRDWSLKAQLVFGKPAGPPKEKTFEPLEQRLFVYGE